VIFVKIELLNSGNHGHLIRFLNNHTCLTSQIHSLTGFSSNNMHQSVFQVNLEREVVLLRKLMRRLRHWRNGSESYTPAEIWELRDYVTR